MVELYLRVLHRQSGYVTDSTGGNTGSQLCHKPRQCGLEHRWQCQVHSCKCSGLLVVWTVRHLPIRWWTV